MNDRIRVGIGILGLCGLTVASGLLVSVFWQGRQPEFEWMTTPVAHRFQQEPVASGEQDEAVDPPTTSADYQETDIFRHVAYLCDPQLQGRLTGTPGERKATAYVAAYMDSLGLLPAGEMDAGGERTWFQKFDFPAGAELGPQCQLSVGGKQLQVDRDWRPLTFSMSKSFDPAGVVFAGYGIAAPRDGEQPMYDSYVHLDVKGKWVLVLRDMPQDVPDEMRQHLAIHASLAAKAMTLRDLGATGMIVVNGPHSPYNDLVPLESGFSRGETSVGAFSLADTVAEDWLETAGHNLGELQKQLDSGEMMMGIPIPDLQLSVSIDVQQKTSSGRNVLGRLQVGKEPSQQVVVVGAHVDHLGNKRGSSSRADAQADTLIHYGADDNASGVAAMLEIAESLADLKRRGELADLQRDIVFAAWSGEELGLHGSRHFVADFEQDLLADSHRELDSGHRAASELGNSGQRDNRGFSLDGSSAASPQGDGSGDSPAQSSASQGTVSHGAGGVYPAIAANLNMDMVGRYRDVLILQGLGSSSGWGELIERANFRTRLNIKQDLDTNLPTDARSFYDAGVPIIAAFTKSHSDYHTPRDTPDKIKYAAAAKIAQLMGNITLELAKRDEPLAFSVYTQPGQEMQGTLMTGRARLGTMPDYAYEGEGLRLDGTSPDSPAASAGLQRGDVVLKLAGRDIENIQQYMIALNTLRVGRETEIVIKRGEEILTLKIRPGVKE